MTTLMRAAFALLTISFAGIPAYAQTTREICSAASAFLARNSSSPLDGLVLASWRSAPGGLWETYLPGSSSIIVKQDVDQLYLAYFLARPFPSAGVLSAKISLASERPSQRTNYVGLYRPAVERGENSCEGRRRPSFERKVRLNEYIDYHGRGAVSSDLEDFHLPYRNVLGECVRSDRAESKESFQFDDVQRTQSDTFIAQYFSISTTPFEIKNTYKYLKTELHYRQQSEVTGTCFGFSIPMGAAPSARFILNLHGIDAIPFAREWSIKR